MQDEKTSHIPEEWLVPTVSTEEAMADSLGSYRLCFEVAAGGMATVYLALYEGALGFEKVVALKKIHKHLARERQFVDMFFDEARIAAFIDHPFVCKVVDFGHAQDSYYLAMEYLVGEPLSAVFDALERHPELAASPALPRIVARVVADLCEGLHAAHELTEDGEPMGLVHRDVTPANLFVLYDGTVRVVDFGIAKAKNRISHTETGHVKGKYAYVSPEQLQTKPVDRRCDVWALGVVMWELLTVRRLFKRESPVDTIRAVTRDLIRPPSSVRPDIPPELDEIVIGALSRRPERRYRTARDMAVALEGWLASQTGAVPRADLAEWLETLFPHAHERKRQLIELTRRGESAIPIADREAQEGERGQRNVAIEAPTAVFLPADGRPAPDRRGGRRTLREPSEPTAEVLPEELEEVRPSDPPAEEVAEPASAEASSAPLPPAAPTPMRVDDEAERPPARARPRPSPAGWLLAAVAVLGLGAGTAAWLGRQGAEAGQEGRAGPLPVASPPEPEEPEGAGAAEDLEGLERLGAQADPTEVWPPWAGPGPGAGEPGATGEVTLTARGGWADVYIEGREVGRTPQDLRLPAGRHRIVLRPWGGDQERPLDVEVRPGRRVYLDVAVPPQEE